MKKLMVGLVFLLIVFTAYFPVSAQMPRELKRLSRVAKTPVKFNKIEAYSDGRGVWLEWQMDLESNNLGFMVYKLTGDQKEAVNRGLISGAYMEAGERISSGRKYTFFDASGDLNSTYTIESINLNGQQNYSSNFSPKAVEDLSAITGISSAALKSNARTANPTILKAEKVLPADLQTEVNLNTPQADSTKQFWVASQPGVKISVKREGIYRVTQAQLQAAGFNLNASTALWQLYADGVEQAITVGNNGDYIEFYGRGLDTLEADAQTYFLVVGNSNGKRIGTSVRRPIGGRISAGSYAQSFTKKERFFYSSSILNGEAENFFGSVITNNGAKISFDVTGVDFSSPNSSLDVSTQGLTVSLHQVKVVLNGHEIGLLSGEFLKLSKGHFDFPTSFLLEGTNILQLNSVPVSGDVSLFDSVKINFARKFQAEQNRLSFYTTNYRASYVGNFTSPNVRVYDVTYPDNPTLVSGLSIEQNNGSYRVFLPASRGRVMYAVEDSAVLSADSIMANQPSSLATANHNAELVIITYKDWAAQANDWAAYRRAQGMSVEVVNVEDVYDEFSFGALSSLSIKDFLRFATGNWQTPPKYVLLLGDATYDPKNYLGKGYNDFIPTRFFDTDYTEAGSDDALTDFNGDGLTEIPIGRVPAKNGQDVTHVLNKVTSFEQTVGQNGMSRGVAFVSDASDGYYDFVGISNRVRGQLPQSVPTVMVNRAEQDARTRVLNEINKGKFLVNWSGHGTAADWVSPSANFFNKNDALQLTNSNLSIFTMLTCLNGNFINPDQTSAGDSLGEALLKAQYGAVAAWASSGLTTADVQEIMATRFYQQMGAGNFNRLGDAIKDAKTAINGGRDVRLSWVLLGDPTLKVR
jgi:hypothetical protein